MIIFGVRSPLVVDLEETLLRLGVKVSAAVSVNGVPRVIDRSPLVELDAFEPEQGARFIVPAFSPERRRELVAMARELGMALADAVLDPTAVLPRSLRVGAGSYVNAGVVIGGMSMLGEGVFVNRAASLGHHTLLADYVTIGPGATLAGNINIGANSIVGAGATIFPHVRIGENCVVSAGSVVRKDMPDATMVVGNPAKPMRYNPQRSSLNVEGEE